MIPKIFIFMPLWKPSLSYWSNQTISDILHSPLSSIDNNWPSLVKYIRNTRNSHIATLATISVESRSFEPIQEYGGYSYYMYMYDISSPSLDRRKVAIDLGNIYKGDGARYCGRGYIQLTGRNNYLRYGNLLGINLIDNPDLALDPDIAARIFNLFFETHNLWDEADNGEWTYIRRVVNGGLTHINEYMESVNRLLNP